MTIKVNDKVRVVNCDWAEGIGQYRAVVNKIWENNQGTWVTIRWTGSKSKELTEKYGVNFSIDELRKIE